MPSSHNTTIQIDLAKMQKDLQHQNETTSDYDDNDKDYRINNNKVYWKKLFNMNNLATDDSKLTDNNIDDVDFGPFQANKNSRFSQNRPFKSYREIPKLLSLQVGGMN